jgi:hypothetical protein
LVELESMNAIAAQLREADLFSQTKRGAREGIRKERERDRERQTNFEIAFAELSLPPPILKVCLWSSQRRGDDETRLTALVASAHSSNAFRVLCST